MPAEINFPRVLCLARLRCTFYPPFSCPWKGITVKARFWGIFLLAALVFSALVPGTPARAATTTWTVTKTADTDDGTCDADCSLREAIGAAQDGDTVVFASGVTGTITLGSYLYFGTSITITGPVAIAGCPSG